MRPKHKVVWAIFVDGKLNNDAQWKKGQELANGCFFRHSKKAATRLVDKLYREHGVVFYATVHRRVKKDHGQKVYVHVILPIMEDVK